MTRESSVSDGGVIGDLLTRGLRTPDAPALIFHDRPIGFGTLDDGARRVAGGLRRLGVGRGDRVAVWLAPCPEWIELLLAAGSLGAIVVAVNTRLRAPEVGDLLARARPRVLVMSPGFRNIDFAAILDGIDPAVLADVAHVITVGDAAGAGARRVTLDELRAEDPLGASTARAQDRVLVFASSGTTSAPKLVAQRQQAIVAHAAAVATAYGYTDPDAVLMDPLPMCGTFGFTGLSACLHAGRPTVLMDVFDPGAANALVGRWRATHILGGDDMLRGMLEAVRGDELATLRSGFYGLFSGDAAQLVALGDRCGVHLSSGYGSTEVCALFTHTPPDAPFDERAVTGGRPVHRDAVVRVRDLDSGRLVGVGDGVEGELEIRSPSALDGLLADPEREAERFTDDGFVRTGDIGYVAPDGRMVYVRRAGDAMRLSGFLVGPREIEEVLERHPDVDRAVVVQVSADGGPRALAFVVAPRGRSVVEADVLDACRDDLARHKQPVRVVALDALPLVASPNGNKIDRRALAQRGQELVSSGSRPSD